MYMGFKYYAYIILFLLSILANAQILINNQGNATTLRGRSEIKYAPAPPVPSDPGYRYRPLIGGLKIEFYYPGTLTRAACTIGVPAYYRPCIQWPTFWGFITAGHCLKRRDYAVYQNFTGNSNDLVGYVKLSSAYINGHTDSAFVAVTITKEYYNLPPAELLLPRILHLYQGTPSYVFVTSVLSSTNGIVGQRVFISGYRSGALEAVIEDVGFYALSYSGRTWWGAFIVLQIEGGEVENGDSGSPYIRP